jgi:hypothetical protein
MELSSVSVNVKVSLLLLQKSVELQTLSHYLLLRDEVELVKDIYKVDLVTSLYLSLDNLAKLIVELLN